MNEVYKFIKTLDIKSEYIIVAVSGGIDSMFLLKLLCDMKNDFNKKIVVAHVHHNLRKESDEELKKVKDFCIENEVIFEYKKIEKYPNNRFSEEKARKIRYEFFEELIRKYKSDILFTAHHGDDQIETILMRITRGSNLKGYSGIQELSTDRGYKIARPLIFLSKEEIENEFSKKSIWHANDLSNKDNTYTRNRFRNNIIPLLKKENNNLHIKFNEFSKCVNLSHDYIYKESIRIYFEVVNEDKINIVEFNKLHLIIKKYILEIYMKNIYKENIIKVNHYHINNIIELMNNNKDGRISLPDNKIGIIEYNIFKIANKEVLKKYNYIFEDRIVLNDGKSIVIDNSTKCTSNYVIHLNSKEIKLPFHVRCRKNNDFMTVKNMIGKKKINEIFTDSKIEKDRRDSYPIVTDDDDVILWIPGIKKSNFDRKNSKNYDIILKYN